MATKYITKTMGRYRAKIVFDKEAERWSGFIFDDSHVNSIYGIGDTNLDKLIAYIDGKMCFYNNKDLELDNSKLPVGWHVEGD